MLTRGASPRAAGGFTLIELLVATLVSLILIAGVVSLMVRVAASGAEAVRDSRLNQQLRTVLNRMSGDLERSGYINWRGAWDRCLDPDSADGMPDDANGDGRVDMVDLRQCLFRAADAFGPVRLYAFPVAGDAGSGAPGACDSDCDCVLFAYDLNGDGRVGGDRFERFGFRWNDGAVEMRTAGDEHRCDTGIWQDMTDGNVRITRLAFDLTYDSTPNAEGSRYALGDGAWDGRLRANCEPGPAAHEPDLCLNRARIDIALEGELAAGGFARVELESGVRIRNDHVQADSG